MMMIATSTFSMRRHALTLAMAIASVVAPQAQSRPESSRSLRSA
jgi:hypothetical protein